MDLACKMKFNIRIVRSFRVQEPFALRQINKMPVFIFCDIRMFIAYKIFQLFRVFAGDPAGFIKWQAIELQRGDEVRCRRSTHVVKLVRLSESGFFEALRSKLSWGEQ